MRGTFAQELRRLREAAGLTQEELAQRAGLTPHAVSALERGTRTRPYPHTVRSLATALGIDEEQRARLVAAVPGRAGTSAPAGAAPSAAAVDAPSAAPAPALAGGTGTGVDLPAVANPLEGRDEEVAALLRRLVDGPGRLVTLTGPGGVGKTRLAIEVAARARGSFPDGVRFVALADVAEAGEVVPAVARAFGVALDGAADPAEVLGDHLRPLHALLVLDNLEHLLGAAQHLGWLVASCPSLRVLATSRAPLRVRVERELPLAPLAVPAAGTRDVDALLASPAAALFVQRARAVSPELALGATEVGAVADVCRRLEGIPLALELAAARVRALDLPSLAQRLERNGPGAGGRDLPARQRTMRATLDWSYGLLDPAGQRLFRVLGAFTGGAALEQVEDVVQHLDDPALPVDDVLPLLESLVEHSLLVVVPPTAGRPGRFRMLRPVEQYADSLLVGEEREAVVAAHAAALLALSERAFDGLEGADQVSWLERVEVEEANAVRALQRSVEGGDLVTAGRMTWALWLYWWLRGQLATGRRWAEVVLERDPPPDVRARVTLTRAAMAFAQGDLEASAPGWQEVYESARERGDAEVMGHGRAGSGLVLLARGDLAHAEQCFRDALPLSERAGARGEWLRALVHVWLGTVRLLRDDAGEAVASMRRGLDLARARGDRLTSYIALYNLSQAAIAAEDPTTARVHLEEGIALSMETRDHANLAYFLEALAVVEAAEQRFEQLAVWLGAAQVLREDVGASVYGYYRPDEGLARKAQDAARDALGDDAFDDALDRGRALSPAAVVALALGG